MDVPQRFAGDAEYQEDITEAGRRVDRGRKSGDLRRILWLLSEKSSWNLEIAGEILELLAAAVVTLTAIQDKLNEGVTVDLGPTNALLQQILEFLVGPGQATSLDVSFGAPRPEGEQDAAT